MFDLTRRSLLGAASLALAATRVRAQSTAMQFVFASGEDGLRAAAAEFQRRDPGPPIEFQPVPFAQMNAQVSSRLGSQDDSLDLFGVDAPRVAAFAHSHILRDLSGERTAAEQAAGPHPVETGTADGKLVALPMWTSTQVLFYNREHLKAAGLADPSEAMEQRLTWEALLPMAARAKQAGARSGFAFDQFDRYYQLQPLFESSGAGSGLTGKDNLTPAVTTADWVRTMAWYGKLFADGLSPRGVTPEQSPGLFAAGQVTFFYGGPWNVAAFARAPDLRFGIAPVPYFQGGRPVTPTDSWMIGVSPFGRNQDRAVRFARFITLDPQGAMLAAGPQIPADLKALGMYAAQLGKQAGSAAPHVGELVTYELANTAISRPRSVGYVAFEDVLNRTFSDVRNGADAGTALAHADRELHAAFSRIR